MRKFILFLALLNFIFTTAKTQDGVRWWRSIGGTEDDSHSSIVMTRSGLLISAGRTSSNNGDITGSHGGGDVLISALRKNSTVAWLKVVGGSLQDGLTGVDIDTLTDGNILVGFASPSNDFDVSGNHGGFDLVFKKYTETGALLWSKTIGGSGHEGLTGIKSTPDGGAIVIGTTSSNNDGDVGPNHGTTTDDIWIVKLDGSGNIQWQKCYGGTGIDKGGSITPGPGGGYYFSAAVQSIDGNLTGLVPPGTPMGIDVWLVKINGTGTIEWSKQIGGSAEEEPGIVYANPSGVYVTFGTKSSDRDIPTNMGLYDIALFKYNTAGTFVMKRMYASFSVDSPSELQESVDGKLYLTGVTYSSTFAGFPIANPGGEGQVILMRIDTLNGNPQWVKTYGGTLRDFSTDFVFDTNGDIYMSGLSQSNNYDASGNHGNFDAIVFCIGAGNRITGNVYIDRNGNNTFDDLDSKLDYIPVQTSKNGSEYAITFSDKGNFSLAVDTGLYSTRVKVPSTNFFTVVPDTFQCTFNGTYQTFIKNFRVKTVPGIRDMRVYMMALGPVRPAFRTDYLLVSYNYGTDTVNSGYISLKKDPRVAVTSYSRTPSAIIGDSVIWNFTNLKPFDSIRILIKVTTPAPPSLSANDVLRFTARIRPLDNDVYPADNTFYLNNTVVGPLDPNEKINLNGDTLTRQQVQNQEYINYVIHFQNVGTAPAFDVIIRDTLTNKLQASTLEPLSSSHPYKIQVKDNIVEWKFIGINLMDSTTNEQQSHGYVGFRLKPVPGLLEGDSIKNKASIYFDYNDAVVTAPNTVRIASVNIVTAVTDPSNDKSIIIYPNPLSGNQLNIMITERNQHVYNWRLIDLSGHIHSSGKMQSSSGPMAITTGYLSNGMYILELNTKNKTIYKKVLVAK